MATDAALLLVQAAYADFQRGDIANLLARLTDDIVWTPSAPAGLVPWGGARTGKDGVSQFFEQLGGGFELTKFDPSEFIASGDRVVVLVGIAGNARATGVHVSSAPMAARAADQERSNSPSIRSQSAALTPPAAAPASRTSIASDRARACSARRAAGTL
jgi:uncharacterized protein